MVSDNEITVNELVESLIEHVYFAKKNHIQFLPGAKSMEKLAVSEKIEVESHVGNDRYSKLELLLSDDAKNTDEKLEILHTKIIGDCRECKLCENRTQVVFGSGDSKAQLLFVGEGPGADEDRLGEPFVGRSGKLLTKMIEAMGYSREQVYICNVVKCRPPNNRDPQPEEVESCLPLLKAQLKIIRPKVIVTLGRYACQTLLETTTPMGQLRGHWNQYEGVDLMPTFHPAFLLRNPSKKKEVWEDLQKVMSRLAN